MNRSIPHFFSNPVQVISYSMYLYRKRTSKVLKRGRFSQGTQKKRGFRAQSLVAVHRDCLLSHADKPHTHTHDRKNRVFQLKIHRRIAFSPSLLFIWIDFDRPLWFSDRSFEGEIYTGSFVEFYYGVVIVGSFSKIIIMVGFENDPSAFK